MSVRNRNMKLDDKTTIPLWAVFSSIPFIVGFIFWISFLAFQSDATAAKVDRLEQMFTIMYEIQKDVAVIKQQLTKEQK